MRPASRPHARRLTLVTLIGCAAALLAAEHPRLVTAAGRGVTTRDRRAAHDLASRVTITRDTLGVPHIVAHDEEAAAFAFGYAMAEDHAPDIGRKYLAARGESARHFGQEFAGRDFAMLRLRNREAAREALREVGDGFRRWLQAFADGVNAYVASNRDRVPAWMPSIEASDPLAYGRMGSIVSALEPPRELLRKYPAAAAPGAAIAGDGAGERAAGEADEEEAGSNAFALAGSKTTTGVPMLLGNPHLRWSELYWEAHVTVPGEIDFYGSTLVGIPVLRAGFNDRLAYVQTNNAPDQEDIHRFARDPARPGHYLDGRRPRPIERRRLTIGVRQPDGTVTEVTREFAFAAGAPVIHESPAHVFTIRSMALESWRNYEGFYHLWRARSREQYERVLDRRLLFMSNFTYADVDGNILYRWNARLPRRRDPALDVSLDVDAGARGARWRGLYDARSLPQLLNPRGGYVQNANNAPWWTSLTDRLDPSRYPPVVEREPLALRPQVALEHLETRPRWSPRDVLDAKHDTRVLAAGRVLPDLFAAAAAAQPPSADLREALDVLRAWDQRVAADSRGAVLFQRFWDLYRQGRDQPFAEGFDAARPLATPRGLADTAAALAHLETAARQVRERHGDLAVAWGAVHRFRARGLDLPADGLTGLYGLYRVVGFDEQPDGQLVAGHTGAPASGARPPLAGTGDAWILLVQLSKPVRAWSVLAYGQSSDDASPHSRDQLALFARHELRPAWFTREEVAANAERTYSPGR